MDTNKMIWGLPRNAQGGLRYSVLAQAAAITVATIGAAHAQQAASTGSVVKQDVIVVTGIRKGIEDAISVKKGADGIVESVSAEDIGKLPDSSIAESIARQTANRNFRCTAVHDCRVDRPPAWRGRTARERPCI
jgi:hypothetical protein